MKKTPRLITFAFLQLFAVQTTDMDSQGNDLSPGMRTFYDDTLIDIVGPKLVHDQDAVKKPIPANNGKKIQFRGFNPLPKALTALTEGVTPAGNSLDMFTIEATVAQYGDYITTSDMLNLTHVDPIIAESLRLLGDQAGVTLDTISRNVLVGGTNVMYAPKINASTGAETEVTSRAALDLTAQLTVDLVDQVVAELEAANVPKFDDGFYHAIIHPYTKYVIMKDDMWREPHKYVDTEAIYNGEIGEIGGVRFKISSEAKIWSGEDLARDSRDLTLSANISGAVTSISFSGGTVADDDLIGRKIMINGVVAEVTDNTSSTITVASTNFGTGTSGTTKIYPGEGGKDGLAVFACLFYGKGAYATTEITGGGLKTIVKQLGSAGSSDPLDQRSSTGWKATKVTEILHPDYLIRVECCSARKSAVAKAN